jgi:hypothetical protein
MRVELVPWSYECAKSSVIIELICPASDVLAAQLMFTSEAITDPWHRSLIPPKSVNRHVEFQDHRRLKHLRCGPWSDERISNNPGYFGRHVIGAVCLYKRLCGASDIRALNP